MSCTMGIESILRVK